MKGKILRIVYKILIATVLVVALCTQPVLAFEQVRSHQTNIMYYIDIQDNSSSGWHWNDINEDGVNDGICGDGMSDYIALKTIQGIVNRDAPRLLMSQGMEYYKDEAVVWREYYENKGYRFVTLTTMVQVIDTFKSFFKGTVTYEHTFSQQIYHWPELDMASIVGSLTDRIPIQYSRETYFTNNFGLSPSTTLTLTDTFTDYYDSPVNISGRLETYDWTTPYEAYLWGYNNLMKFCNPHEFHHMAQEDFDNAVERKMFYSNLLSKDTNEFDLLNDIFDYYDARNDSWPLWGWVDAEDYVLAAMTPKGGYILAACSTNLSFHNKIPNSRKTFSHSTNYTISNTTLENKHYIMFMAADNDSPRVVSTLQQGAWLDSNRGNVPINWGFEASLSEMIPAIAEYYYDSATNNDFFFSGGASAIGFTDYDELPVAARDEMKQLGSYYMQKTGQKYLDLYSQYGNIGQYNPSIYADQANEVGIDGITLDQFTPEAPYGVWGRAMVLPRPQLYPIRTVDFSDNFSSGSSQWTAESGSWAVESGEYSQNSTYGTNISTAGNSSWTYINLVADVKKISSTSGSAGIAFRKGTGNNYYWFYLKDGNKAGLKKVVNNVETLIGSEVDFEHNADTAYTLKVVANGTSIKCYANNNLVVNLTDSTFASGKLGLVSNSHAHFDNVKAATTTQVQQIINYIKSITVDVSKSTPSFQVGYYGWIFTGEHEKTMFKSEPSAGMSMVVSPTDLKEVQDTINGLYPGQFKFVRYDEMISAAKIHYSQSASTDTVRPVATAVEGLGQSISLNTVDSAQIRARITENINISTSAATLKWNVPGKTGIGSAALTGAATSGIDIAFESSNINLNTGITGGVDVGDKVNFWVEGSDVAGNTFFSKHNSSSEPLASIYVSKSQVDAEKWNGWSTSGSVTKSTDTTEKKNGSYSLKVIYPNISWSLVQKTGTWNASGYDGIGFWVKSTVSTAYVKVADADGTTFQSSASITPNQWSYVYVPFTANVSGGDGVFNESNIVEVNMFYDTTFGGSGATYYLDDIEFAKDRIIHVDEDKFKDWFIAGQSINNLTVPAEGLGGSYTLKAAYGGTSPDWQFANIKSKWNAYKSTGLGLWIKTSLSSAYLKMKDGDGTVCESTVATTPNVWSYVYLPFTYNVSGGDGVFNSDYIVEIDLIYYRGFGDGSSYYSYYYDNIDFINAQTSDIDSETYENWAGSNYNVERTSNEKHSGTYSLKVAYHNEGSQWQYASLGGRWDASAYTKIGFWIKAPMANGYVKVYDSDGTCFEGNVTPTANSWTYVTIPFTSNVSGGDGTFNKDRISSIQFIYYNGWGTESNDYSYYYDDISFTN